MRPRGDAPKTTLASVASTLLLGKSPEKGLAPSRRDEPPSAGGEARCAQTVKISTALARTRVFMIKRRLERIRG